MCPRVSEDVHGNACGLRPLSFCQPYRLDNKIAVRVTDQPVPLHVAPASPFLFGVEVSRQKMKG